MNTEIIVLLSSISTALIGLFALCVRYSFLSKCVKIKCCCIEIERDIGNEIVEQNIGVNNNITNNNSPRNNNFSNV